MNHELENRYGLPCWLDLEWPTFPALAQNRTTDVAIFGVGITGLKLVQYVARYGFNITIPEGGRVGDGASTRNHGSVNLGPNLSYPEAIERYSREVARELWQLCLEKQRLPEAQMAEMKLNVIIRKLVSIFSFAGILRGGWNSSKTTRPSISFWVRTALRWAGLMNRRLSCAAAVLC